MSRLIRGALPAALLLALAAVPAGAHEGNPNYRSVVRAIVPATEGLTAQVLDHDDALQMVNHSDRDVVVLGDGGVPYARLLADGTVQINDDSPALDEDDDAGHAHEEDHDHEHASRDGQLQASLDGRLVAHGDEHHHEEDAPAHSDDAAPGAAPAWRTIDRTGRLQWHDARIKYRASAVPPQVSDESKETKVKDWRVPLAIGGAPGAIEGTLTWVGEPGAGSSFPTAAVVSLVVLALLAVGAVVLVRRRRAVGEQT